MVQEQPKLPEGARKIKETPEAERERIFGQAEALIKSLDDFMSKLLAKQEEVKNDPDTAKLYTKTIDSAGKLQEKIVNAYKSMKQGASGDASVFIRDVNRFINTFQIEQEKLPKVEYVEFPEWEVPKESPEPGSKWAPIELAGMTVTAKPPEIIQMEPLVITAKSPGKTAEKAQAEKQWKMTQGGTVTFRGNKRAEQVTTLGKIFAEEKPDWLLVQAPGREPQLARRKTNGEYYYQRAFGKEERAKVFEGYNVRAPSENELADLFAKNPEVAKAYEDMTRAKEVIQGRTPEEEKRFDEGVKERLIAELQPVLLNLSRAYENFRPYLENEVSEEAFRKAYTEYRENYDKAKQVLDNYEKILAGFENLPQNIAITFEGKTITMRPDTLLVDVDNAIVGDVEKQVAEKINRYRGKGPTLASND